MRASRRAQSMQDPEHAPSGHAQLVHAQPGHARAGRRIGRYAACALLPVLALGLSYSFTNHMVNQAPGETGLAALSLLRSGTIADPYLLPTGPTAHTSPGTVAIVAIAYALFDGNTPAARIALSLLATALYVSAAALVLLYCRRMRLGRPALAVALLLTCVLPVHLHADVVTYRQWDQPVTALLLTLLLLAWMRPKVETHPEVSGTVPYRNAAYRPALVIAVLGGLGGLFAPALPMAAILAELALGRRLCQWRPALAGVLLIVAALLPWGLCNERMLGAFILTRSNFPLELAAGNHDAATGEFDLATIPPIHPHDFPAAAQHMAEVGEVAYMAEMHDRAFAWIASHRRRFVALSLRRAWLLLFPEHVGGDPLFGGLKRPVIWATGALTVAMLALVAIAGLPVMPWLVCIGLPLAPYVLTHTEERYAFPISFAAVCLIATGVDVLCRRVDSGDGSRLASGGGSRQ